MSSPSTSGERPERFEATDGVPTQSGAPPPAHSRRSGKPYFEEGLVLTGVLVVVNAFVAGPDASGFVSSFITVVTIAVLVSAAIYGITRLLPDGDNRSTATPPLAPEPSALAVAMPSETTAAGIYPTTPSVSREGARASQTVNLDLPVSAALDGSAHAAGDRARANGSRPRPARYEQQIEAWVQQSRGRFEKEIRDLSRRGRFNLALGVVIGGVGLSVLLWSVLDFEGQIRAVEEVRSTVESVTSGHRLPSREWQNSAILQAMRVSLSLILSAFAFFFLRLYRSSLDLIKYYQNELTNVEGRYAALVVALRAGDTAITGVVVDQLSRTERNFVLKQGETTVELELARQDGEKTREVLRLLGGGSIAQRVRNLATPGGNKR
jgi:hypothetical protein